MAIPRASLAREAPVNFEGLADIYRRMILELKETAVQRLVSDSRVLTAEARRARLLIREVSELLARTDAEAATWIAENVPKAYLRGTREAQLALGELGVPLSAVPQPVIHEQAIQVLVNDLQDTLAEVNKSVTSGVRQVIRRTQLRRSADKIVTERIAQGIGQGQARREVSKEIARRLVEELGSKTVTVGTKKMSVDAYAAMVARTKTAEAVSAGTVNRLIEEGHDLVMVSAHGATDGCAFYEGRVFSISGTHKKYAALDSIPNGGPPFHPNCKHRLVPFVEELASGAEKRQGANIDKAALGKSFSEVNKLEGLDRRVALNTRSTRGKINKLKAAA